jgi:UDP-glucose 4-epimerase
MAACGHGEGGDALMKKRVLVTGVAGLIGSHLAKALLEKGYNVVGADDLSQGSLLNIKDLTDNPAFTFHRISVMDERALAEAVTGVETIFHLAALKIPRYRGYLRTLEVNTFGTEILLECARQKGCRVIFASTDDVYGKNPNLPLSEEATLVLGDSRINRWGAASSKIFGEHLCFGFAEKYKVPVAIIRYAGVYGPAYQLSTLSGVQDIFIFAALTEQPLPIHGDGTQVRTFTYISDAIEATLKVLETPYADAEVINIGSEHHISIINLAYLVWRLCGSPKKVQLRFIPYTDFSRLYEDANRRIVDVSKAKYLLGHIPKVPLEEGIVKQIDWFKRNLERVKMDNPDFALDG